MVDNSGINRRSAGTYQLDRISLWTAARPLPGLKLGKADMGDEKRGWVPIWVLGLGVVLTGFILVGVKFDWFGAHTTSTPPAALRRSLPLPEAPIPDDIGPSRSPSTAKVTKKGSGLKIE